MRRASRQKTNGAEWDWTDRKARTRRIFGQQKPGLGKFIKRGLARKRRRERIEHDDE